MDATELPPPTLVSTECQFCGSTFSRPAYIGRKPVESCDRARCMQAAGYVIKAHRLELRAADQLNEAAQWRERAARLVAATGHPAGTLT